MPINENHIIEWKSEWRDDFLPWICGFANGQGGTLIIGRDDKTGEFVGLGNPKKLLEDLPNKIKSTMGIVVPISLAYEGDKAYISI
jgi:ATP-dependent DNA helicase RecG